ncbi:GRB2-associated-binding protein 2 isoform X2 [Bicyclus anynana]|uniref:GRB2-associated-binding protein 2 isoform X2 n=1 Tax=Bicyclus anynana TaxID=110368 RepID=A0A6J1N2Z9_BICAN|nr:GRB2-associated-binding protein 2 isoform X2 [Bicyclus anynana]
MSKNIVFEGWLTKSPPSKRIWRTKWRRRWFALRQSGELPGQYFLDYYADRNCRRLKGTINLDFCEQVDAGLHMERGSHGSLDPTLRGSVFTIQTQTRIYHLEADCEADMERWVNAICRVCGLRATDDRDHGAVYQNRSVRFDQENIALRIVNDNRRRQLAHQRANQIIRKPTEKPRMAHASTMTLEQYGTADTGAYIPISECTTGSRAERNVHIAFNFDPRNILITTKAPFHEVQDKKRDFSKRVYFSQPQIKINDVDLSEHEENQSVSQPEIRINDVELSEYEENQSEDECTSMYAGGAKTRGWTVSKTFTKLSLTPNQNKAVMTDPDGPPIPPRPPKTFKNISQTEVAQIHNEPADNMHRLRVPQPYYSRRNTPPSPGPSGLCRGGRMEVEEESSTGRTSHYCNLTSVFDDPPAVDRALKPRHCSHTIATAPVNTISATVAEAEKPKLAKLEYLDLDLPVIESASDAPIIVHGRSRSSDADAYKVVDFIKTEAFVDTVQECEDNRAAQL